MGVMQDATRTVYGVVNTSNSELIFESFRKGESLSFLEAYGRLRPAIQCEIQSIIVTLSFKTVPH